MKLVHPGSEDALEQLLHQRDSQRRLAGVGFRGILPATSLVRLGDYPAFMSEWVDGLDLLDWVEVLREQRLRMPGSVVCELVRNVASTLDAALSQPPWPSKQALRVLHGDLKPSNILIHRDGEVRVTDFGTGFTSRAGRGGRSGALKRGLAKYLAPERREGGAASAESDMYALGVIALELFRGRWLRRLHSKNPAHDRHLADTVAAVQRMDMRTQADDSTARSLLLRMLAHDPSARPSAAEVAHTFRSLADRSNGSALEPFVHSHLVPSLEPLPQNPDRHLNDIRPTILDSVESLKQIPLIDTTSLSPGQTDDHEPATEWEIDPPALHESIEDTIDPWLNDSSPNMRMSPDPHTHTGTATTMVESELLAPPSATLSDAGSTWLSPRLFAGLLFALAVTAVVGVVIAILLANALMTG